MDEVSVYHASCSSGMLHYWSFSCPYLVLFLVGTIWTNYLFMISCVFPAYILHVYIVSFVHLRYWLLGDQLRAALLNWFLTGFHWVTTINNFIICVWPDIWNLIGELERDIVLREEDPELKTCSCLHLPSNTLLSVLTETHRLPQVYENTISWFPNETG